MACFHMMLDRLYLGARRAGSYGACPNRTKRLSQSEAWKGSGPARFEIIFLQLSWYCSFQVVFGNIQTEKGSSKFLNPANSWLCIGLEEPLFRHISYIYPSPYRYLHGSAIQVLWFVTASQPHLKQSYPAHRSRSSSKIDLRFQQKFQWDMKFWGKSYQKTSNSKKSAEGP